VFPPLLVLLAVAVAWVLGPEWLERATWAALHGLCGQRASHSFWFGPYRLPFDARMTGIYSATLLTVSWLAIRARWAGLPPRLPALLFLAAGVVLLAVDGLNSLALDLGLPTLYAPRNMLRYATGAWTGLALGALLWWVFVATTWQPGLRDNVPVFRFWRDVPVLGGLSVGFGALLRAGPVVTYPLVALGLVGAAVLTLGLLAWPFVLAATGRLERAATWSDLALPVSLAGAAAVLVMALTSLGRFALESTFGLAPLP